MVDLIESRIERVTESGCWIWMGGVGENGQGYLDIGGNRRSAHQVVYEQYCGDIPARAWVTHGCGVTVCVNPAHLRIRRIGERRRYFAIPSRRKGLPTREELFGRTRKLTEDPGCWLWAGSVLRRSSGTPFEYGVIKRLIGGRRVSLLTHRVAWELVNGPIPYGLFVCHECDTPTCIRPGHLFLGTSEQNSYDRHAKGRSARGEMMSKLKEAEVIEIRSACARGETQRSVAQMHGIAQSHVGRIVNRQSWGWLAALLLLVGGAKAEAAAPRASWELSSMTGALIKEGADRLVIFGARAQGVAEGPLGVVLAARADATATVDGGAQPHEVSFASPESFTDLELNFVLTRPIASGIGPAVLFGYAIPFEAGRPAIVERYPRSAGIGLMARSQRAWFLAVLGQHQAAGDPAPPGPLKPWGIQDARLIVAGQVLVDGRTSLAGEVVMGPRAFARGGVVIRVGGSE